MILANNVHSGWQLAVGGGSGEAHDLGESGQLKPGKACGALSTRPGPGPCSFKFQLTLPTQKVTQSADPDSDSEDVAR
jgi:hypothetical protein